MSPDEHAKELSRLKGRVTRARARMKTHTGTLATKLALKVAVQHAEEAVRQHKLAFYALTFNHEAQATSVLTETEAKHLAAWVCTHDTGAQPAGVATPWARGWAVEVHCQAVAADGSITRSSMITCNYTEARAALWATDMTANQLKEVLTHFSTRRLGLNPFDHVLELGNPRRAVDVQEACAMALTYILDLEVIALAYNEEKPYGPTFVAMLQARHEFEGKLRRLQDMNNRQYAQISEMNQRLAAAGG